MIPHKPIVVAAGLLSGTTNLSGVVVHTVTEFAYYRMSYVACWFDSLDTPVTVQTEWIDGITNGEANISSLNAQNPVSFTFVANPFTPTSSIGVSIDKGELSIPFNVYWVLEKLVDVEPPVQPS